MMGSVFLFGKIINNYYKTIVMESVIPNFGYFWLFSLVFWLTERIPLYTGFLSLYSFFVRMLIQSSSSLQTSFYANNPSESKLTWQEVRFCFKENFSFAISNSLGIHCVTTFIKDFIEGSLGVHTKNPIRL